MQKLSKAVFPVAGFGTRFLPATKAMPKELLPIVDKPLIQYAAEEAIAAGIDTLILRNQPAGAGGEIQLADAINTQAAKDAVEAVTLNGRRFDCGSVQGYLDAIMHVADRRTR